MHWNFAQRLFLFKNIMIILTKIYYIIHINTVFYYLKNYRISFFKDTISISVVGNVISVKPREFFGHSFKRNNSFGKRTYKSLSSFLLIFARKAI